MIIKDKALSSYNSIFKMCFYPLLIRPSRGTIYCFVPQKTFHHQGKIAGILLPQRTGHNTDMLVKDDVRRRSPCGCRISFQKQKRGIMSPGNAQQHHRETKSGENVSQECGLMVKSLYSQMDFRI